MHYDGSRLSNFADTVQVTVTPENQPFSSLHHLYIDYNTSRDANVSVVGEIDEYDTKVCLLISFDDVEGDVMIHRDVERAWCIASLRKFSAVFEATELLLGSTTIRANHYFTSVDFIFLCSDTTFCFYRIFPCCSSKQSEASALYRN